MGCRGREGGAHRDEEVTRIAFFLAERLADQKSLAFFRKVARSVPENVIHWGLRCALDLKVAEIEVSRGAYFTALMRPYLPPPSRQRPA